MVDVRIWSLAMPRPGGPGEVYSKFVLTRGPAS